MPRQPGPVRPRVKDEKAYEAALRQAYLDPIFARLQARLAQVQSAKEVWPLINQALADIPNVPRDVVEGELEGIRAYHIARFRRTFKSALGVDIKPLLSEMPVNIFMRQKIAENVGLIKTIPPRMHESLRKRVEEELIDAPFDQQRLRNVLKKEYKSSGYNLRRLTRDQTSKTIGNLTEIRQRQLGLDGYQWGTSQDEKVRPTHVANSGKFFLWSSPPPATGHPGHDVLCRCVPFPVVTQAARERIQSVASSSIIGLAA